MTEGPERFSSVRAILFDLDGTLIATSNRWGNLLGDALARLPLLPSRWDGHSIGRRVVMAAEMPMNYAVASLERLRLDRAMQGLADRVRRSRGVATHGSSVVLDGAAEAVRALAPHYRLAVVTTRARREAYAILDRSGLHSLFSVVVTRQDVCLMKPHPQPILRAAARLGVPPAECAMVGDAATDMRAARSAGALAVGVLTGMATREELERAGAQWVLARVADLGPALCGSGGHGATADDAE